MSRLIRSRPLLFLTVAVGYLALSRLGLELLYASQIPVLWPASGFALAMALLVPRRRWILVAAGAFCGNLAGQMLVRGADLPLSAGLAAANAVEPVVAAGVALAVAPSLARPWRGSVRQVLGILAGAAAGCGLSGLLGALVLHAGLGVPFWDVWWTWWVSDALGVLALAPPILAFRHPAVRGPDPLAIALAVAAVGVVAAVFLPAHGADVGAWSYTFPVFPLFLLLAVRGRARITALALGAALVLIVLAHAHGRGPFTPLGDAGMGGLAVVQGFLATLVLCTMAMDAITTHRRTAERRVRTLLEEMQGVLRATTEAAVIATDRDGVITVFNEGAERMLGYRAAQVVGRFTPAAFLDPAEMAARAAEAGVPPGPAVFAAYRDPSVTETRDWTYIRSDGTRLTVSLSVAAMVEGGRVHGYVGVAQDMTATRAVEAALRTSAERYRRLVSSLPDAIVALYDRDLRCVVAEGPMLAGRGVGPEGLVGRHVSEIFVPARHAELLPLFAGALEGRTGTAEIVSARDGRVFGLEVGPSLDGAGGIEGVFALMRDVTERRRREEAVRRARGDLEAVFRSSPIGQMVVNAAGRIMTVNPAMGRITGGEADALRGRALRDLVHRDDADRVSRMLRALASDGSAGVERELRMVRGPVAVPVIVHAVRLPGGGDPGRVVLQVVDMTERKRYEARLQHMADHDPLTGLLNRRRFESELDAHIERVRRGGPRGALLVLDLDHFKQVNDTLGHTAGDELIIGVAHLLRERLRSTDVLARLGGDEFAVLLPDADAHDAGVVADGLVQAVRTGAARPAGMEHRRVTASVGVAVFDGREGLTGELMLVDADLAMYDAKEAGRDRHAVFASDGRQEAGTKSRLQWVDRLEQAIATGDFVLLAQPIRDLRRGLVTRHELLVRMRDPGGELIPPAAFLPVAERHGLVGGIDRWVSRQAVELLARLRDAGTPQRVEINISGASLTDETLMRGIEADLARTGVDPRYLIVEITETAAVSDIQVARRFAERLRALGCRFALDDFGAGFGSFYYLKHLPFDYLKIDGEFVRNCVANRDDRLVIEAVVQIARGMGKRTVAEFVGDEETLVRLAALGVDFAQGYHVGRPVPLEVAFPAVRAAVGPVRHGG